MGELIANTVSWSTNELTGKPRSPVPLSNGTSFNYDLQLSLDTSFSGKDLLRTVLRAGNFADSVFGGEPHAPGLSQLEIAFQEECGNADCGNVLAVYKLFYQLPLGAGFTATVGPRVGQEDMLALWPSAYPSDTILNVFTVNGAPAAYNKNLGAGAGIWWQKNAFSISANYGEWRETWAIGDATRSKSQRSAHASSKFSRLAMLRSPCSWTTQSCEASARSIGKSPCCRIQLAINSRADPLSSATHVKRQRTEMACIEALRQLPLAPSEHLC